MAWTHRPITPETDPAGAFDEAELLRRVDRITPPTNDAEFNYGADAIVQGQVAKLKGRDVPAEMVITIGEHMMMQVAFFNFGHAAPAHFINKAHAAGWRWEEGHFRRKQSFSLEILK